MYKKQIKLWSPEGFKAIVLNVNINKYEQNMNKNKNDKHMRCAEAHLEVYFKCGIHASIPGHST
jgi:hypothetical protein